MEIRKFYLTNNDCYKQGKKHNIRGILVHSTGANNPWLSRVIQPDDGLLGVNKYNNHWNMSGITKCVHAFIGKDKDGTPRCYQTLPWDMAGWHSGTGSLGYSRNANNNGYIGFEICEDDLMDKKYFAEVYRMAVELCAYLCRMYSLSEKEILGHYEGYQKGIASNHGDPKHWFSKHGKSMDTFRNDVKKELIELAKIKELEQEIKQLKSNNKEYDKYKKEYLDMQNKVSTLEKELKKANQTISSIKQAGSQLEKMLNDLVKNPSIEKAKKTILDILKGINSFK